MSFRTDILANVVQPLMPLCGPGAGNFDIWTSRVFVRSRVWDGGEVGIGNPTVSEIEIFPRPKVQDMGNQVLHVTRIIPQNAAGGFTWLQLRPDDAPATEYYYVVIGPDGIERGYNLRDIDTRQPIFYGVFLQPLDRAVPF